MNTILHNTNTFADGDNLRKSLNRMFLYLDAMNVVYLHFYSTVYRAVTWFVPSVRSRLVILEEFGFRSRRPDQVSCDWRRAGHVTPVLTSYWPGGADQSVPERDLPLRLAHHLLPRPEHGQGQLLRVHPEGNNQIVKIFTSNKNICKMSGSGETHIADENDRDNERDDSTLPLKK